MRVVVFGAGYFGKNYIRELGHKCVLVVDPDSSARAQVEARFGVETAHALPDGFDFEYAVVVTPPDQHFEIAQPLLEQGKYVLVEKPFTGDLADAGRLAAYDRCMAGLVYLYHPEVDRLKDVYETFSSWSHFCSRRTNDGPVRSYGDALWDLAPHDISIFNYITGRMPVEVSVVRRRDFGVLGLDYGDLYTLTYVSWRGGPKVRQIELVPESGPRVIFDDLAVVLEEPPLTRMIKAFLSKEWNRCTARDGANVLSVLSRS